jgi:hypothetical protein
VIRRALSTTTLGARLLSVCFLAGVIGISTAHADASGRAKIQQPDGSVKVYNNVHIRIQDHQRLLLESNDGKGTLIINKGACNAVGGLLECFAYSAELDQNNETLPITLRSGTVWINLSGKNHALPHSTTQFPPRGVVVAVTTNRGTQIALSGTIDEVTK